MRNLIASFVLVSGLFFSGCGAGRTTAGNDKNVTMVAGNEKVKVNFTFKNKKLRSLSHSDVLGEAAYVSVFIWDNEGYYDEFSSDVIEGVYKDISGIIPVHKDLYYQTIAFSNESNVVGSSGITQLSELEELLASIFEEIPQIQLQKPLSNGYVEFPLTIEGIDEANKVLITTVTEYGERTIEYLNESKKGFFISNFFLPVNAEIVFIEVDYDNYSFGRDLNVDEKQLLKSKVLKIDSSEQKEEYIPIVPKKGECFVNINYFNEVQKVIDVKYDTIVLQAGSEIAYIEAKASPNAQIDYRYNGEQAFIYLSFERPKGDWGEVYYPSVEFNVYDTNGNLIYVDYKNLTPYTFVDPA